MMLNSNQSSLGLQRHDRPRNRVPHEHEQSPSAKVILLRRIPSEVAVAGKFVSSKVRRIEDLRPWTRARSCTKRQSASRVSQGSKGRRRIKAACGGEGLRGETFVLVRHLFRFAVKLAMLAGNAHDAGLDVYSHAGKTFSMPSFMLVF